MRRLLTFFDRTVVLAVGVLAGFAIGLSFNGAGREQLASFFLPSPEHFAPPPTSRELARDAAREGRAELARAVDPRVAARVAADGFLRVGVFGDSFGDGVWAALYEQLPTKRQFKVLRFSKEATGFTRYRTLNLEDRARAQVRADPIDVAVICFGANDTQAIYEDGHLHPLMSAGWQAIIGARIDRFVAAARGSGATVFWVGLPVMRDARLDDAVRGMNAFYKQRMAALGVPFIETRSRSVDAAGHYAGYLDDGAGGAPRLVRANDGIHMTILGYERLTSGLAIRLRDYAAMVRAHAGVAPVELAPAPAPTLAPLVARPHPKRAPIARPTLSPEEADRRATARANRHEAAPDPTPTPTVTPTPEPTPTPSPPPTHEKQ